MIKFSCFQGKIWPIFNVLADFWDFFRPNVCRKNLAIGEIYFWDGLKCRANERGVSRRMLANVSQILVSFFLQVREWITKVLLGIVANWLCKNSHCIRN